jgi:hypothetical protein
MPSGESGVINAAAFSCAITSRRWKQRARKYLIDINWLREA